MSCYIQTNDAGVFGFAAVRIKTCQIKKVEDINLASLDLEQEVISCNLVKTGLKVRPHFKIRLPHVPKAKTLEIMCLTSTVRPQGDATSLI